MKYDVFISHSSKDLELSEKICDYLQSQGINCWIDSRNVAGLYARSIMEGIEQSEMMVLVYSGRANSSAHVENEIDNAFCLGKMIIPFRIEGTPYSDILHYYLNKSHYVDGMPEPLAALEQLRDQIKRNMSEQKQLEKIDEAFKTVANWVNVDIDRLREVLKELKTNNHGTSQKVEEEEKEDEFEQMLTEFIQNEFDETSEKDEAVDKDGYDEQVQNSHQEQNKDIGGTQEGRYDILQNAAGEILIIIKYHEGDPDNPRIVYDGTETALLYRSKESAVLLEHINLKAREPLMKVENVLIVEVKDDDVAREYKVPMRKIRSLKSLY